MATAHRGRGVLIVVGIIVLALIGLRIAAPPLITRYVNDGLADLGNYRGHIDGVDLSIWRGAATVHRVVVEKIDSEIDIPLVEVPRSEMSLQWNALLHGELVGEIAAYGPRIHFVQQRQETQYGEGVDWRAKLEELMPVRLNRVIVKNGQVHFQNPTADPPVDVYVSKLDLTIENLTNIRESSAPVYTALELSATAMENAPLRVQARLDPLQDQPQFDLNVDLENLELTQLNPLLKNYVNITAEDGTFSFAAEVAAAEGAYDGYVKPLFDHAEFIEPEDFKERPLGAIWESVVAAFSQLFENQSKDRLGTRIPISGEFTPEPDIMAAIGNVFRNMFDAFLQGVEGTIDLRDALEQAREEESQ